MNIRGVVICVFVLVPGVIAAIAGAQGIIKYRDSEGHTHYVDSIDKIPPEYRQQTETPQNLPPVTSTDPGVPDSTLDAGRRAREQRDAERKQRDAEQAFQRAARDCSVYVGGEIIQKPGGRIEILGTAKERFDFAACMNSRGQPMDSLR